LFYVLFVSIVLFYVLFVSIVLFYVLFVSIVLFCVLFVSIVLLYVLFVCKCVLYYWHRVATQLLLTNISCHLHLGLPRRSLPPMFSDCMNFVISLTHSTCPHHSNHMKEERMQQSS